MLVSVSWPAALAWRMERQLLAPVGRLPVDGVVRRLGGVQAQVASAAELGVRVRREDSMAGEVDRALADGALIKTWAMRGALHLLAPDVGSALLSLISAARPWSRPGWDRYFDMNPDRWAAYFEAARTALDGTTLTREELIAGIGANPDLRHLADEMRSGWGTMLKPLAWQGELCFGPSRGTRVTFRRPADASPDWTGLPAPEEAAPIAVEAYFGAYGPATLEAFNHWMGGGWLRKRAIRELVGADGGGRLAEVDVDGRRAWVLAEHVDALAGSQPTSAVRLLPNFDAWVLGPGSKDEHVVPPGRLAAVSRQAGWISPVVIAGGKVAGTWRIDGDRLAIDWFSERGRPPRNDLAEEIDRLAGIVGRGLAAEIRLA
jgi:Winged helix DNA-binding domain